MIDEAQIRELADLGDLAIREGILTVRQAPGLEDERDWDALDATALTRIVLEPDGRVIEERRR